jgi:hypothetical protein
MAVLIIWLRRTPDPVSQQVRWTEQLEEYDLVVEHRPGNQHGNADAYITSRFSIKSEF